MLYFLAINFSGSHDDRTRLFFRPLSVQERIRELNLRARHFAETIMAVQLHETLGSQNEYAALMHTRSLQVSIVCHGTLCFYNLISCANTIYFDNN